MKNYKKIVLLILILFSPLSFSNDFNEDFRNNSVTVTSVSEILQNKNKKNKEDYYDKYNKWIDQYCGVEINTFCNNTDDNLICLRDNFNLITGDCLRILKTEFGKGVVGNTLMIHDLKLSATTKYYGYESFKIYKEGSYKTDSAFSYRGLKFRKGSVKARSYAFSSYKGQYVLSMAYPIGIFKDEAGIEYNANWQKGPFFFDENGNVKIGTLSKDFEYKKHLILKRGSIIAFDDERRLIKGVLSESIRFGRCSLLSGMEINEDKIENCLKK